MNEPTPDREAMEVQLAELEKDIAEHAANLEQFEASAANKTFLGMMVSMRDLGYREIARRMDFDAADKAVDLAVSFTINTICLHRSRHNADMLRIELGKNND